MRNENLNYDMRVTGFIDKRLTSDERAFLLEMLEDLTYLINDYDLGYSNRCARIENDFLDIIRDSYNWQREIIAKHIFNNFFCEFAEHQDITFERFIEDHDLTDDPEQADSSEIKDQIVKLCDVIFNCKNGIIPDLNFFLGIRYFYRDFSGNNKAAIDFKTNRFKDDLEV